jgi:hypothetical protein
MKFFIEVTGFNRFEKGTLRGFCDIVIRELRLAIHEIAVHEKNGSRWASMPAKPWLGKDGVAIRDDDGKIKFSPLFEFETRELRAAFSAAVWKALLEFDPDAVSP